jgi:hypothetical protein
MIYAVRFPMAYLVVGIAVEWELVAVWACVVVMVAGEIEVERGRVTRTSVLVGGGVLRPHSRR